MKSRLSWRILASVLFVSLLVITACGKKEATVTPEPAPAPPASPIQPSPNTTSPSTAIADNVPALPAPTPADSSLTGHDLNELNQSIPLAPIFFNYDSAEMTTAAQSTLANNAEVMRNNLTWIVTIEGHCDERGTAEYNLALSERRALAARNYLVALGIPVNRLRTVSYGEEFPFDPGNDEAAWAQNRRAHFVVTAQ